MAPSTSAMMSTSLIRGTLVRTWRPSASRQAAISLRTEFLAPPARTVPDSGPLGVTTKRSPKSSRPGRQMTGSRPTGRTPRPGRRSSRPPWRRSARRRRWPASGCARRARRRRPGGPARRPRPASDRRQLDLGQALALGLLDLGPDAQGRRARGSSLPSVNPLTPTTMRRPDGDLALEPVGGVGDLALEPVGLDPGHHARRGSSPRPSSSRWAKTASAWRSSLVGQRLDEPRAAQRVGHVGHAGLVRR